MERIYKRSGRAEKSNILSNSFSTKNFMDKHLFSCGRELREILKVDMEALLTIEDFEERFQKMADQLLNEVAVYIGGEKYRFTEIEFYFNGGNHKGSFSLSKSYHLPQPKEH